jgi:hypothetical protein
MQKNDPADGSEIVKIRLKKIRTLNWSPQNPDLNPKENVCEILKSS